MPLRNISRTCVVLLLAAMVSACAKEGCTNEDAINYNIVATKDDGSCIVCGEGNTTQYSSKSGLIFEDRFSTEFYGEPVLELDAELFRTDYPINNCQDDECYMEITVTNITDKDMMNFTFQASLPIVNSGGYNVSNPIPINLPSGNSYTFTESQNLSSFFDCQPFSNSGSVFSDVVGGTYE